MEHPISQKAYHELIPTLIGAADHKHFITFQGEIHCIRETCEGCSFLGNGCESEEVEIQQSIIPHSRRGVGFEERPFLILLFKEGHSFSTLPQELWDNPLADRAYAHEGNLHWALTDPKTAKFHTLKQQLRYYGTREEFSTTPYAEFLEIFDEYVPQHRIVSLDYSAIEPRVSTLVSREPEWIKVFAGEPKVISKQIALVDVTEAPSYVETLDGETYCYLEGEMDKEVYEEQCSKCPVKDRCTVKMEHYKNVATDWHGINTEGLYGEEFTKPVDKFRAKELRGIGKIVGLALCYGGSAWTVAKSMQSSVEEAQARIDNFFRKLTVLASYMTATRTAVRRQGFVVNLFGRVRDVSQWAWSKAPTQAERRRDAGYAERTGLNHPIQSSAAEILKIGAIRANEYIRDDNLNPIGGYYPPVKFEALPTYRDFKTFMASSVHDEMMYVMRDDSFDSVIPMLYIKMQLTDVLNAFGMPFQLEMDCEYDETRSWTASEKFHTAKIYLLARLAGLLEGTVDAPTTGGLPNAIIIDFESVTPDLLSALGRYLENTPESAPSDADEELYELGVNQGDQLYLHGSKFPRSLLESLSVTYRMAIISVRQ